MSWRGLGKKAVEDLRGVTDENAIKVIGLEILGKINEGEKDPKKRENARKAISDEIRKVFPRMRTEAECIEEKCLEFYYRDPLAKKTEPQWRHCVFKYLRLNSTDYDAIGGEARAKWKAEQSQQQSKGAATEQKIETEQAIELQTKQEELTPKDMSIEQLGLDAEAIQILERALKQSGKDLKSFVRTAVQVYSKTILGRNQKHSEDLTTVSTHDLLTGDAYKTHPGRARELTKRAIQAIMHYNSNTATSNADRWFISPSAIATLTGSKHKTIKEIIEAKEGGYSDQIASHHGLYEGVEPKLTPYSNRKPGKKIEEVVKLAELVPSGLD